MEIKITSQHLTDSGAPISNFFVSISEFYINVNSNTVTLRTNITNTFELNGETITTKVKLLESDPLYVCLNQERDITEWKEQNEEITLTNTRYNIQANLLFELIFYKINKINAETPNKITFELIGFE